MAWCMRRSVEHIGDARPFVNSPSQREYIPGRADLNRSITQQPWNITEQIGQYVILFYFPYVFKKEMGLSRSKPYGDAESMSCSAGIKGVFTLGAIARSIRTWIPNPMAVVLQSIEPEDRYVVVSSTAVGLNILSQKLVLSQARP